MATICFYSLPQQGSQGASSSITCSYIENMTEDSQAWSLCWHHAQDPMDSTCHLGLDPNLHHGVPIDLLQQLGARCIFTK